MPMKGDVTAEAIEEHLKAEKLPLVIEFNDKNSQKIFSAGIEKQVWVVCCADCYAHVLYLDRTALLMPAPVGMLRCSAI